MTEKEKFYTVWCGEYSDRTMSAIFRSKEKAEKYVEVQDKLNMDIGYSHYIVEYTLADDGFDINTEVSKMYYCIIYVEDEYDSGTKIQVAKGDITTDSDWDELMRDFQIESYDDLKPENYGKDMDIDKLEMEYCCSFEMKICSTETIVEKMFENTWSSKYIIVYSKRSYAHARKIAIDKYYEYLAQVNEV